MIDIENFDHWDQVHFGDDRGRAFMPRWWAFWWWAVWLWALATKRTVRVTFSSGRVMRLVSQGPGEAEGEK